MINGLLLASKQSMLRSIFILGFCVRAVLAVQEQMKQAWSNMDLVRWVDSDYDPKTGEERIWHVYDKGQKPSSIEEQEKRK